MDVKLFGVQGVATFTNFLGQPSLLPLPLPLFQAVMKSTSFSLFVMTCSEASLWYKGTSSPQILAQFLLLPSTSVGICGAMLLFRQKAAPRFRAEDSP